MNNQQGKLKSVYKKIKNGFNRYINGTKGVISLFLAILMVPFVTIAGALVNAARVNSAIAIFDEALCNASNSTLGTYDDFLRKRFGLLAVSQSSGGSDTPEKAIDDIFKHYIEQNMKALSNTFSSFETSATGVYPLSDIDVLSSQVHEYGKTVLPAKLVMDGLAINNLIAALSEPLDMAKNMLNIFSDGVDMGGAFNECQDAFDELMVSTDASKTAEDNYTNAFIDFSNSVSQYNSLIDAYNAQQSVVESCTTTVQNCYENLLLAKTKKAQEAALDALNDAEAALNAAIEELNSIENDINAQRVKITEKQNDYSSKIGVLIEKLKDTKDKIIAAQDKYKELNQKAAEFGSSIGTTVAEVAKNNIEKSREKATNDLIAAEAKKTEIENDTKNYDTPEKKAEDINNCQASIDELKKRQENLQNAEVATNLAGTGIENAEETFSEIAEDLTEFSEKTYKDTYDAVCNALKVINQSTLDYVVSEGITKTPEVTIDYYYIDINSAFPDILRTERVEAMLSQLAENLAETGFMDFLNSIFGIVEVILNLELLWSSDLINEINPENYSSIGGLTSYDATDRLKSEFEDTDRDKSNNYKILLGGYSSNPKVVADAKELSDLYTAETLKNDIEDLQGIEDIKTNSKNIFGGLGSIVSQVGGFFKKVSEFIFGAGIVELFSDEASLGKKMLLLGYVAYNVPNRTTYTGSALTGEDYSLPSNDDEYSTYAFHGAMQEYIFSGFKSEPGNQSAVFGMLLMLRIACNVLPFFTDKEFKTIFAAIPTVILKIVVGVLYILVEGLLDTLILVNGGEISMLKTGYYLTPTGINNFITDVMGTTITKEQKLKLADKISSTKAADKMFGGNAAGVKNNLTNALSSGTIKKSNNKFLKALTFDYTEMLLILMLTRCNSQVVLNRLADVIQMEVTYNQLKETGTFTFDLDKSYTYIRAYGKFTTNEFIKISDSGLLNSKERIVYRGY